MIFGGYTATSPLHEGRRIRVLRGIRDADGLPVIIKALRRRHPPLRDIAKLRHEFELLRRFDDDRIVRAIDLVEHGSRVALVLEDFGGDALRSQIPLTGFGVATFLRIAISLCEALAVVHRAGVLHKDIKPDNIIFLETSQRVALTDFSIASLLDRELQAALAPETLEGSLAYLSPEQTGRMNRLVDYRSDFYSLGVTLYELLLGTLPFRADSPLALVHAHIARRPIPPGIISDDVPLILSKIIMRLLEKNAEDRYQSAKGLLADLRRVQENHRQGQTLADFTLAQNDHSERFSLSTRLFGREEDTELIMAAFDRACAGSNELILLGGPGGIGKSALVRELQRPMAMRSGAFVTGKFDALDHGTPYSALTLALRELVLQLLGQPEVQLERWRTTIGESLGHNAQLVIEMIPELGALMGPQPEVPPLPAAEAANRFHDALRLLISAFARDDHPLAIVLDDLQWADLATLALIEDLVGDFELAHILWIGTYRDSEVPPEHPLTRLRSTLLDAGASVSTRILDPLGLCDVEQMVAATLRSSDEEVRPLAALIHRQSEGNPFFVRSLLETLHEQSVLTFDDTRGAWTWEMSAVNATSLPENVIALVTQRIRRLGANARDLLRIAAGIGGQFELNLLGGLAGTSTSDTLAGLWEAMQIGLIRPVGDDYKFLHDGVGDIDFTFTHDRIQQAAYALLEADERQDLHVRVGRLMLASTDALQGDATLFAIAGHFAQATARIHEPSERLTIAKMMLRAASRAKMSTAYEAACGFLRAAGELLPEDPWSQEPALIAALGREEIECEFLVGRPERAVELFAPLLAHTDRARDRADLYTLLAVLETNRGDVVAAVTAGRQGLAAFGYRLPAKTTTLSVLRAFARFQLLRGRAPVESILDLPLLRDLDRRSELRVLMAMAAPAYFVDTNLASVILLRIATISLKHGINDITPYGLVGAGLVIAGTFGRYEPAYALAKVAKELNHRLANAELQAKIALFSTTFMMSWTRPFDEVRSALREASEIGIANGDIIFGVYSAVTEVFIMVLDGTPLGKLSERCQALMPLLQRRKLGDQIATVTFMIHVFGRSLRDPEGRDPDFDKTVFRDSINDTSTPLVMFYYHLYLAMERYFRVDDTGAREALEQALSRSKAAFGSAMIADLHFYECLILARSAASGRSHLSRTINARIRSGIKALAKWSRSAPCNYSAREALVRGEWARLRGDDGQALRSYNQAIARARKYHSPHIEALAAECALRFASTRDFPILARAYLVEAISAYRCWGALAKVHELADEFAVYLQEEHGPSITRGPTTTTGSATMTRATTTIALDLDTVNRATRAISSELAMDRLLSRLMTLLVENAAARRGVLLLNIDGDLRVEAEAISDEEGIRIEVGQGIPTAAYGALPLSVINLVTRTRTDVVLGDAIRDPIHGADAYLRNRQIRSMLCTAISHQGELTAVLYLENDLAGNVFTHRRLALIKQIAAQVAISLTNARLYDSLNEARIAALAADRAKTRFLMNMSHELRTPLNAILGYTELIAENFAAGETATIDNDLRSVHRAGIRLLRSVSSILELTRIETNTREAHTDTVDLETMLPELLKTFEDTAALQGNSLRIEGLSPLPPLLTDEHMLRYALTTLLDNACRFTDGGAVTLRVAEFTRNDADWIEFSVADTGSGIGEEALPKLFTAFHQVDDSPSRRFEGTGVSLAVTAHFCERLGGEIDVTSTPSLGSVFTIRLPRLRG